GRSEPPIHREPAYHPPRRGQPPQGLLHPTAKPTPRYLPRTRGIPIAKQAHVRLTASAVPGERLDTAIAAFLAERDLAPSSHRVYALALGRLQDQLGADTLLPKITPRRLAQFMTSSYEYLAPASWNRVIATLGSFFAYTTRQGWTAKSPAAGLERRQLRTDRDDDARRRAIPMPELTAFLNAEHPLREKTLWWLCCTRPRPARTRSSP
ncbi:MAG: site-specific integrase, partial [Solirubrobacteraceae bacterium]